MPTNSNLALETNLGTALVRLKRFLRRFTPARALTRLLCAALVGLCGCAVIPTVSTTKLSSLTDTAPANSAGGTGITNYVAIGFPSGFTDPIAKALFVSQVEEMRVGASWPAWKVYFNPDEAVAKSLYHALLLKQSLSSQPATVAYLLPYKIGLEQGRLFFRPDFTPPPNQLTVTVAVLDPLHEVFGADHSSSGISYSFQGVSFGNSLAPFVTIERPSENSSTLVGGTWPWATPGGMLAVSLPAVVERRWGFGQGHQDFLNYKNGQKLVGKLQIKRPAKPGAYFVVPSFISKKNTEPNFRPYWNYVAAVIGDILSSETVAQTDQVRAYLRVLNAGDPTNPRDLKLAALFMKAEHLLLQRTDASFSQLLVSTKWMDSMEQGIRAEASVATTARNAKLGHTLGLVFVSGMAGAAAALNTAATGSTAGSQEAAQSVMFSFMKATANQQSDIYDVYRDTVAGLETSQQGAALGLSDEAATATFKNIDQIRDFARKKLAAK